jgi:hypothetical protein
MEVTSEIFEQTKRVKLYWYERNYQNEWSNIETNETISKQMKQYRNEWNNIETNKTIETNEAISKRMKQYRNEWNNIETAISKRMKLSKTNETTWETNETWYHRTETSETTETNETACRNGMNEIIEWTHTQINLNRRNHLNNGMRRKS